MLNKTLFGKEVKIKLNPKKVEITVKKGDKMPFCVDFDAGNYGAGFPCDNEEEIKEAIESHKNWITKEGDVPIVRDLR